MAKKDIYKVKPMTEGKRNIIAGLLQEYDIQTAEDIQDALKDLLGGTIQEMLENEMNEHLGYEKYERTSEDNYRNGKKTKRIRGKYGEMNIDVPQDRKSSFEPRIVPKRKKDISAIEEKIISLYAKGMTTRQISDIIEDIYGFEVSESLVSDITDKLLPQIEEWQNRPLSSIYPIVFIDAVHFSVRNNGIVEKVAAYIILGINTDGKKDVLSIEIGKNESSKFWLGVLNSLKNRGVKDIFIICADGLAGIKESINTAFPNAEYQRCIVHQVRNTLKHVSYKDMKAFANDLKSIYHAPNEEAGFKAMESVTNGIENDFSIPSMKGSFCFDLSLDTKASTKWEEKYPRSMKSWSENWDLVSPIFKFSEVVRKVIYTTNAIESLNSSYKRLNRQRSVFPSVISLQKALYLATTEIINKWTLPLRNWGKVYGELCIMYGDRIEQ